MARHYATRDFFRQMPNPLLARYFHARGVFDDLDITALPEPQPEELWAAWLTLDDAFQDIAALSGERRYRAILDDAAWHFATNSAAHAAFVEQLASLKRFSNRPCTTWGGRGTSARTDAGGPMRAYSMDLRERALLDSDAGMKAADVAAKYRVSGSWVRLLKQRRRETGEVAPRVQRHGRRGMLDPHLHTLADLIAAHPDRKLAELKEALAKPASVPTVWRAVRALGLTMHEKENRNKQVRYDESYKLGHHVDILLGG